MTGGTCANERTASNENCDWPSRNSGVAGGYLADVDLADVDFSSGSAIQLVFPECARISSNTSPGAENCDLMQYLELGIPPPASWEDALLQAELDGYADYARRIRFRLVPGVW